jgi:hypothetical protein
LIGVKTDRKLKVDFVDVELPNNEGAEKRESTPAMYPQNGTCFLIARCTSSGTVSNDAETHGLLTVPGQQEGPKLRRSQSRAFLSEDGMPQPIEFFVASDASAVIEHTKRVLYLEDDDIAHISEGGASRFFLFGAFGRLPADGSPFPPSQSFTSTDFAVTTVFPLFELSRPLRLSLPRS